MSSECGPPRRDRYVGIFYFLWHWERPQPLYNNDKLLNDDPLHPAYGGLMDMHYWGEPWLGYYLSTDPFVIRKHAQQLDEAGVDTLIFDTTNGVTFDKEVLEICHVYEEMLKEGQPTPKFCYFFLKKPAYCAKHVYDLIYSKGLYKNLWFYWKGKPLLIGPTKGLPPEFYKIFTVRESGDHNFGWMGDGHDKWRWIDRVPQHPGWSTDPAHPEEVSVAPASHPILNIGRSYYDGSEPSSGQRDSRLGTYFDEQWRSALSIDPEFVFVTSWNEWIANKFVSDGTMPFLGSTASKGSPYFVDEYDPEFSRDLEPMAGELRDDYYYQLASFVRRFKGVPQGQRPSSRTTIPMDGDFTRWGGVAPEYRDFTGDTARRLFPGFAHMTYENLTGKNDFSVMKVARDQQNVYFYAETKSPISGADHANWMTLLIDADRNHETGWEGYDYAVNRKPGWLERNLGGWRWEAVCRIRSVVSGNKMELAVPRKALAMGALLDFEFKWVDAVPDWGNILDFIDKGDVAPDGRFNYVFDDVN